MQALHIWRQAGAITYNVVGGFLVFFDGRTIAVLHPGYDSAKRLRADMERVGIEVRQFPKDDEEALGMLGEA